MADGQGYSAGNLNFVIQAVGKESHNSLDKMNKSFKASAFSLTKLVNRIYFLRNYTKQLFRDLTGIIEKAVDYTETLNLWQVAMRGNREEAEDFVKTMNKAYGIATQTLMQYQAIFRNMLSSLGGVSGDVSYQLSEYLTQMAIDYASLYNVSIERAMTTFQSVLSGQVRPIRSIAGYDITETTIYQLYQQLGGTKTMRQLSQTEKRLLRIYAVFQQMESSGAIGDLGKTMGSTANQFRMFTESTKELGTWLGIVIEHYIAPALPKLNAFVITLTNIVKAFAQLNNIKPQEFGAVESVEQLNEELEQTQGKLLSFDKFESLNSAEGESNILGIDENLLGAMTQYQSILSNVTGEAQSLAEQWTAIFIDPETGKFTDTAERLWFVLQGIFTTLGAIVALNASKKVFSFIGDFKGLGVLTSMKSGITGVKDALALLSLSKETGLSLTKTAEGVGGVSSAVMGLSKVLGFITSPLGIILTIVGVLYASNEDFRDSINNLFKTLMPLVTLVADLLSDILTPLMPLISGLVDLIGTGLSYVIKVFNISLSGAMLTLVPFAYVLEFVLKILQSIIQALADIASFNWADFGKNQSAIWSNWKSNEFAKSSWSNFKGSFSGFKTGGLVEDGLFQMSRGEIVGEFDDGTTRVANNQQITAGIENASYRGITRGLREINFGGGNVYIDKKKVGQIIAKPSHKEMVRTGLVKVSS